MIEPSYITGEMSDDFEEAVRLGVKAGVRTVAIRSDMWGRSVVEITDEDVRRMKEILARFSA